MQTNIINLDKFRSEVNGVKSRIFSGRLRGEDVRKKSKIDDIFAKNHTVEIIIPEDIFSITPSFFEEFIKNIVEKYGKEQTLKRLEFKGSYAYSTPLNNAIDNILLTKNGLN